MFIIINFFIYNNECVVVWEFLCQDAQNFVKRLKKLIKKKNKRPFLGAIFAKIDSRIEIL